MTAQQNILNSSHTAGTFEYDQLLPNLPLPSLEHTIQRYLESVKPFAENEEEYLRTEKIAQNFLNGDGAKLDHKLQQRAAKQRNWLEKWWVNYAYLTLREPLIPHCNMAGLYPRVPEYQYVPGQQLKYASAYCYQLVQLWLLLRREKLRPAVNRDKRPLSMDQFRRLFNCSVVPGLSKDTLNDYFKTEKEGFSSSLVLVLSNGHMFVMDALRPDREPLTPLEWEHQLGVIKRTASVHRGAAIPYLSSDYRTPWAQNRQYLINLAPENGDMFDTIDTAMFVVCLDDACPSSDSACINMMLCGDFSCRWPDATSNIIFFGNGLSGALCTHSAVDGIVSGAATFFAYNGVKENANKWLGVPISQTLEPPRELHFVLDPHILSEIDRVKRVQDIEKSKFVMCIQEFTLFGKQRIQNLDVHPDTFMQMALQLAYYNAHSRFAPCYETATTRAFYNGRTETVRSCTEECVLWVKAMVNPESKDSLRATLLLKAINKHNRLMSEASNNKGCDRHLFGLYCTAVENNLPIPQLYHDPLYKKSGGGGNFILSTSLLGYTPLCGVVAPMCLDGYGIFYNILPKSLMFTISVRRDSYETSSNKLFQHISRSLEEMVCLLEAQSPSKL